MTASTTGAPRAPHPDLPVEQAYLDHAYGCLDRMRDVLERAPDTVDGEFAALVLEKWAAGRMRTFLDAEKGLCFGRIDVDGHAKPLYVGRRWVHDEGQEVVVVNWQAPAAKPFYTATPVDPQRVSLRRRFRVEGRRLLEIYDEPLGGSEDDAPAPLADALLDELQRSREPRMRDIVATIQADQYRLITRELEGILVIQGGPGTGKTAVALHRASWLLYTYRDRLADTGVLVVGPNPVFMEYVSHVLPALGEDSVEQRPVDGLVDGIEPVRAESAEAQRVKGDVRMAEVLARAIRLRVRLPQEDLWARVGGAGLVVSADAAAQLASAALDEAPSYVAARERFQMALLRRFYERYGRRLGAGALLAFDDVERALRREGFVRRVVDRTFPPLDADDVVRRLLSGPGRLRAAADGVLDPAEQRVLLRARPGRDGWSASDVPLVDEARSLVVGPPAGHGHVIVDEVQDLTPMQLRMVARRARGGSLTILGDIAQATGPLPYERWEDLLPHLPGEAGVAIEPLRLAYRVPREIMELALPLLPLVAPRVEAPIAYRAGGEEPRLVRVEQAGLALSAAEQAALLRAEEGTVGLIAPAGLVDEIRGSLQRAGLGWRHAVAEELAPAVQLLTPRGAKGLEFDRVVLVDPALVLEERPGVQGLRELYVALTRATKTLVIVHARPLPEPLARAA